MALVSTDAACEYVAKTRADADRFAVALDDVAANCCPPRGGAHPLPDRLRLTLYLPLPPLDLHTAFLRQAVERLKVEEGAGARFHHPDHQFADQIGDLDGVC